VFYSRAGETFGPRVKPRIPDNIYIKYIYVSIQKYINNLKHHHIREPVKIQVIKEQFPAGVPPFLIQGCRQEAYRAGIFKKSMGAKNRGGIGLSYRPARLHRLAEFIPWNQFRGPINL
jgi:hypothetical protein